MIVDEGLGRYFKVQLNVDAASQHCDIEICLPICCLCANIIHNLFLEKLNRLSMLKMSKLS